VFEHVESDTVQGMAVHTSEVDLMDANESVFAWMYMVGSDTVQDIGVRMGERISSVARSHTHNYGITTADHDFVCVFACIGFKAFSFRQPERSSRRRQLARVKYFVQVLQGSFSNK